MSSIPLLAGKMKIASSVGIAGVSVVSVPTTVATVGSSKSTSLFNPLTTSVTQAKSWVEGSMSGFDEKLKSEYSTFGTNVANDYKQYIPKNIEVLQEGAPKAKEYTKLLKENADAINYYLFTLGAIVQEVAKSVPNIIRDSVLGVIPGNENLHLLGMQKMIAIGLSGGLTDFFEGIKSVVEKHPSLISQLSTKDAKGVIQIFKELGIANIDKFLKEVKTNAASLESDSSKYCTTKLMLHLLVGKTKIENMKTTITNLKSQLETLKPKLKTIEGISDVLNQVENQLTELSQKQELQDPCSNSTRK